MNCLYCQQACILSKDQAVDEGNSFWTCSHHEQVVNFIVSNDTNEIRAIGMLAKYRDKTYKVEMYYPSYFVPGTPDEPNTYFDIYLEVNDVSSLVLSTTKHPNNVTPENVKDKLPIWLIFS